MREPAPLAPPAADRALLGALCAFAAALPLSIAGANIGWGLVAAALASRAAAGGRVAFAAWRTPLIAPLALFLAAAAASSALGLDPGRSFRYFPQDLHKLWLGALFAVALATGASSRAVDQRVVLGFLAAGFAAAAVVGIVQAAASFARGVPDWELVRAHAFVHPVTFGEQMAVATLGAFCFLASGDRAPRGLPRHACAALGLLCAAALLLSHSRAALLACLAGAAATASLRPPLRRRLFWALPLGAALFLCTELMRPDRSLVAEALGGRPPDYAQGGQLMRLHLWRYALEIGRERLWTGVGHNNFRAALARRYTLELDGRARDWGTADNLFFHHFAERGLLGLGATLLLLGALWARAFYRAYRNPDAWQLWALGVATAFLVMNLTEVALQVEIVWMLVFFVWTWAEVRFRGPEGAVA